MNKNSTESFLKRLDGSRKSVFIVAEYLHRSGYNLYIPAFDYRPANSNWKDHTDNGDIYVWKGASPQYRIDVKHVNLEFTSLEDYPFQHMFVSDIRAVERAEPFPLAYIIVNKNCTHMGIVWGKTKAEWIEKTFVAKNTDMVVTAMACPIKSVDFRSLSND